MTPQQEILEYVEKHGRETVENAIKAKHDLETTLKDTIAYLFIKIRSQEAEIEALKTHHAQHMADVSASLKKRAVEAGDTTDPGNLFACAECRKIFDKDKEMNHAMRGILLCNKCYSHAL